MRAVAAELFVDLLEAADEIDDFAARIGSARRGAEVGPAAEGSVLVNEAARALRIQQGARPVSAGRQRFASGGLERAGREQGLAAGQVRDFAREFEVATLGAEFTVALDGAGGQVAVDAAHLLECGGRG